MQLISNIGAVLSDYVHPFCYMSEKTKCNCDKILIVNDNASALSLLHPQVPETSSDLVLLLIISITSVASSHATNKTYTPTLWLKCLPCLFVFFVFFYCISPLLNAHLCPWGRALQSLIIKEN